MESTQIFPPFDINGANVGPRWGKWLKRFENYLIAMNVEDETRKRAMLLHYAGPRVYDIFDIL